jgi:FMN reductase
MKQLVISCSLSAGSRSAVMARHLADEVRALGDEAAFVDLRTIPLPFCDAGECYGDANVRQLQESIIAASAITIATPIYNYETGGATRNLVALTGQAWKGKVVGFLCAAGGEGSYMAVMTLANSLMLDFRCLIVPRFVYATGAAFADGQLTNAAVQQRIAELARELHRVGAALSQC